MATLKEIKVIIGKDATVKAEPTRGFVGNACLAETKSLEEALGKVDKRDMKPEGSQKIESHDHSHSGG